MGSSNTLIDLTEAVVRPTQNTLNGQVMTRPALFVEDGKNDVYVCDVDVGIMSANGRIDQTIKYLYGVPGTRHFTVNDTLTVGTILRNVPCAPNNQQLRYADVGNAVQLQRTASGQWQIVGFSVELPGTRTRYGVHVGTLTIGPITGVGLTSRPLTLQELSTLGPGFGITVFGAVGLFLNGVLQEISY